jgi:hypothetical protein
VIASRPSSLGRFFHKLSSFKNEKIIKGMIFMKFTEDYGYQYTEEILKQMVNEYNFDVNFIDQNISLVHWRQTPLHGAISRWDVTFTQKLLEWGADPFVKDTEGRTPYENMVHRKVNFEDATIKQLINLLNSACLPKEI